MANIGAVKLKEKKFCEVSTTQKTRSVT